MTGKGLLARTVAGKPMALYRTGDGRPVALADACWHRLAPLSMGKLVGADEVQCPYHGLRYNSAGRCTSMPAQETVNPSAMVPSYPVVERYRYLWVWPGDITLADPDLVPDMHQMDDPEWAGDGLTIHAPCNYQLILDNLMDLTHEEFVHGSSIGQDELSESAFHTRVEDDGSVTVERWMLDVMPPPFWRKNIRDRFPDFDGPRRPVADHPLLRAVDDLHRRGRRPGRDRRPAGRPQPGRQRLRHEHDHARDRAHLATTSGRSCATTGSTAS